MAIKKSEVQFMVNGAPVQAYLAAPEKGGPGVLVLHAWWGLKPFFKQLCDRLAEQGFVALAPDLNEGQIAKTVPEAEALLKKKNFQFTGEAVMAAKDYLRILPAVKGGKIGVVGFSMGGAFTLAAAAYAPEQVAAAVVFYGSGEEAWSKIKAKVLGHYSDVDEWEDINFVRSMESGMKAAGVEVTFHIYPGLHHWFVEDDRPEYDPAAAKMAWERTFKFLHDTLG
jgi:carboxymethylenebutenolidase